MAKDSEISLLKADIYTDQKLATLYTATVADNKSLLAEINARDKEQLQTITATDKAQTKLLTDLDKQAAVTAAVDEVRYNNLKGQVDKLECRVTHNERHCNDLELADTAYKSANVERMNALTQALAAQAAVLNQITTLKVPSGVICPIPMPQYNSWTAPTTTTTSTST